MIISIHIPKCGGTSFRHILKDIYGDSLWLNYGTIFSQPQASPDLLPKGIKCIHGHFIGDAFDGLVHQPQLITWLRHPVERVVSNYFHFLRSPDMRDACCRELFDKKLSLERFAELDWMRNEATRYMAEKPADAFRFIGIMERFNESLALFGSTFGVPVPDEPPRVNINPDRNTSTYPLSSQSYENILALNLRDLMTYDMANAMLDRRIVAGPSRAV